MRLRDQTVIIIGAGAAGLMAGRRLAKHCKVIILEGNDRVGGRMHTITNAGFSKPVEAGAEFIHGKLPVTIKLLKKAGLSREKLEGDIYRVTNGNWELQKEMIDGWDNLMKLMKKEKKDMSLNEFLQYHYGEEKHEKFRRHVRNYAEEFDLADITRASMKALYEEWSNEDEVIYRVRGGHSQLSGYLEAECKKKGCEIITSTVVKQINWQQDRVKIYAENGRLYEGEKCIITVPAGILQKVAGKTTINITPPLDEQLKALKDIGYGTVIKTVIEFNSSFWNHFAKDVGFILCDEQFPAWWTQFPSSDPILTGWKGGPEAAELSQKADEEILQIAMESLSTVFRMDLSLLQKKIIAAKVFNWTCNTHAEGAYSFAFPSSAKAREILNTPVAGTIFFAGEGIYEGKSGGTVEAALISGKEAADRILN